MRRDERTSTAMMAAILPCGGDDCTNSWHCHRCQEEFGDDEIGGCDTICPDSCAGCGGYHCPAEPCDYEELLDD